MRRRRWALRTLPGRARGSLDAAQSGDRQRRPARAHRQEARILRSRAAGSRNARGRRKREHLGAGRRIRSLRGSALFALRFGEGARVRRRLAYRPARSLSRRAARFQDASAALRTGASGRNAHLSRDQPRHAAVPGLQLEGDGERKNLGKRSGTVEESRAAGGCQGGASYLDGRRRTATRGERVKLQKVRAFGFKTFAEPTTLEFGEGVTAIVGPNGSGKSNLVDAFRWVLGETSTKSLRSGRLEDVIFAGNESRKPLGLAEVSILFDNSDGALPIDFNEVEITRRAYRVGESEYFINRSQVRLRDVLDLVMGTGLGPGSYAIVSQGQIDAILVSKPAERRSLFEETAGIGKFLARKHESLRRLERTEQNAIRISDLIAELERRIPELDTQLRRAKRYRRVSTRLRDLEILGYLRAGASRRAERVSLRDELERGEEQRAAAAAKAATLSAEVAGLRTRLYRCELQLEELRSKSQSERNDVARVEADYAAALARREALERQSTQTSEDAARVLGERALLVTAIDELHARLAPLSQSLEEARERELEAQAMLSQARAQLEKVFTDLREVEAGATEQATRKAERRVQAQTRRTEVERLEREEEN